MTAQAVSMLPKRGADLNARHAIADAGDRLAGDLDADGQLVFAAIGRRHPLHDAVGHDHARHFVAHERGVPIARQRPDAGENRQTQRLHFVEKSQQGVGVEHRLGDGELGAGFDFSAETIELAPAVERGGIEPHADRGEGGRIDGLAAEVDAAVEPALHRRHADRIGVEHAGRLRVVAQLRRVAGDEQQVPNAARRAGQQVGLHADQVSVAAAEMEDRLDRGFAEDVLGGHQRREPGGGCAGRREC